MRLFSLLILSIGLIFIYNTANAQKQELDKVMYNAFVERASINKLKTDLKSMDQVEKDQVVITTDEPNLLRLERKDKSVYYMVIYKDGKPAEMWNCFRNRSQAMFSVAQFKEMGYETGGGSLRNSKLNVRITSTVRAIDKKNCECYTFFNEK